MLIKKKYKNYRNSKIKIGDTFKFSLNISEKIHNDFATFSGDKSPIHTKKFFYNKYGYKKKLGYGFLLTAALSQIYGMYLPGGNELCLKQVCNFKKPFFVEDKLKIILKVNYMNKKLKLLSMGIDIINQKKISIFDGEVIFKLSFS
tara:strand:- start:7760 stop:8197 length:438 start_codon:yes stop_codon:yes gene_type:complete